MKWMFTKKLPGEKMRNPISGAFFSLDAVDHAGRALVRESIQNSLDARADGATGPVRVRIYVSGKAGALLPAKHQRWFQGVWPHYQSKNNGLNSESAPRADQSCEFLVIEDFQTTGLTGDQEQHEDEPESKNPFFYFYRAEGATPKSAGSLGRWGIGKQVFPRSSRAQTFFGYSVTGDQPNGFLMGACILKYHELNGQTIRPDGYCAEERAIYQDQSLAIPASDPALLKSFRSDFSLSRQPGQPGLSIVVPWLDCGTDEAKNDFGSESLLLAALQDYFWPILHGKLAVTIEPFGASTPYTLDQQSFSETFNRLCSTGRVDVKTVRRMQSLVSLANSVLAGEARQFDLPPCPPNKPGWLEGSVSDTMQSNLRLALGSGATVSVNARLTVRIKGGAELEDTFACHLRKFDEFNERPCFIRDGIIISDVKSPKLHGYSAIVHIQSGPLADLLGDSENPAHTEWQSSSQQFKEKYVYGGVVIEFVSTFASELLKQIFSANKELDKALLIDYFSDPGPEAESGKPEKPSPKKGKENPGIPPKLPQEPVEGRPRLDKIGGGFRLGGASPGVKSGSVFRIRAAYETSKGNAFKAYQKPDFYFGDGFLSVSLEGCEEVESKFNSLAVRVVGDRFNVAVTGFDPNRDLVVKFDLLGLVTVKEPPASQAGEARE